MVGAKRASPLQVRHGPRWPRGLLSALGLWLVLIGNVQVAVASALEAPPAGIVSRSGWMTVTWGDGGPGSKSAVVLFTLTDDAGISTPLLLGEQQARSFGGLMALNHRRVVVTGVWAGLPGAEAPALQVQSLQLERASGPGESAGLTAEAAVSGPQAWVNILCRFSDVAAEPKPLSYFDGLVGSAKPGLDHYWREASYNIINISGSGSVGWYTLPQTRSYYLGLGTSGMLTQLFNDCTSAADASVFFPGYVGVNLMFNAELDGSAWGGSRWATLDGQSRFWYSTWEPPWGYGNQTVLAHEMGHGFGLPHSSGDYGLTYDNQWDVMSDSWSNCSRSTDPTYGCLGQHTNSYHKDILGWFSAAQRYTAAPGIDTVTLQQSALPPAGTLMAKIPIGGSSTHFYTVEVRRWAGYDVKLPAQAVILHEVDTGRLNPAHVVDADGNGNTGDAGARWDVGETFTDGANGVSVHIDSGTSSGFVVTISLGDPFTPTATSSPTSTGTATATRTSTSTYTSTATFTKTSTATFTHTATATRTFTATATNTPLPTATHTATASNTPLPTATFTRTSTNTALPSTSTYTATASNTLPPTATFTLTSTNTALPPTSTYTATASNTSPPTATFTRTSTNTALPPTSPYTATASNTPPPTATFTRTSTNTALPPTSSYTSTASNTPLPTSTHTQTASTTPVSTSTASFTPTDPSVPTATATDGPSATAVATGTDSATSTSTVTETALPTSSLEASATETLPPTNTETSVPSGTPTQTLTHTATPIDTLAPTSTDPAATGTSVASSTLAPTETDTAVTTGTATEASTPTETASPTPTASSTSTDAAVPSATHTPTVPPAPTAADTAGPSATLLAASSTPSSTPTLLSTSSYTATRTNTALPSVTSTAKPASTKTKTPAPPKPPAKTATRTHTPTITETPSPTSTASLTATATPRPSETETQRGHRTPTTTSGKRAATATVTAPPTPTFTPPPAPPSLWEWLIAQPWFGVLLSTLLALSALLLWAGWKML